MKGIIWLLLSASILCLACAAQAAGKEPPEFTSVRDVLDHTEGNVVIVGREDYIVLILETDGRHIRMAALLDDHARNLYQTATGKDYSVAAMEAFNDYAYTLPFSFTEELAEKPKDQAELDELKGKTIQELTDLGFGEEMIIDKEELEAPVHICLENGLFRYAFEVNDADSGNPSIMTVKSGKFSGFSRAAFDLDIQEKPAGLP